MNNFGDLVRSLFSWSLFGSFQFGNHFELFLFLREGCCWMLSGCLLFYHHYTERDSLLKHVCITERLNHYIVSYCLFAVAYLQSVNRICGTYHVRNTRVTTRSLSNCSTLATKGPTKLTVTSSMRIIFLKLNFINLR